MNHYEVTVVGEVDGEKYKYKHSNLWTREKDFVTDVSIAATAAAECTVYGPRATDGKRQKYLPVGVEWLNAPALLEKAQ